MPFDMTEWNKPAVNGEVAGIAIASSLALLSVANGLRKIAEKAGVDVDEEIAEVRMFAKELDKFFNEMTGYQEQSEGGPE